MFGFDLPMQTLAGILVAFLAGASCPAYYAQERLRGFGRAMFARLPYQPPPGMDAEQAMQAAVESAAEETVQNQQADGETKA